MKRLLSFLSATIGAVMGVIFFLFVAAFCAEWIEGDNTLAQGFFVVFASPFALIIGSGIGIWLGLRIAHALQRETDAAKQQRMELWLVAGVMLLYPGSLALMAWGMSLHAAPPSDKALLANFANNEATFTQLVAMMQADKKSGQVVENWTHPEDPKTMHASPERRAEYQRLLKTINISHGFEAFDDGRIEFYSFARGSAISSDQIKGYAFLTKSPKNLRKELGDSHTTDVVYRHIQGNWYLFYEYIPTRQLEKY